MAIRYSVKDMRAGGLEARWSKSRSGRPVMLGRKPGGGAWWLLSKNFLERAQSVGVMESFSEMTLLGSFFSVPV